MLSHTTTKQQQEEERSEGKKTMHDGRAISKKAESRKKAEGKKGRTTAKKKQAAKKNTHTKTRERAAQKKLFHLFRFMTSCDLTLHNRIVLNNYIHTFLFTSHCSK